MSRLNWTRPASIKETAMIATTIAAIGRNQVTSTPRAAGPRNAQPAERTNSELIPPSDRLDLGVSGNQAQNILASFRRRE
jgi:hypothetical protein